ncbi:glycerate kinase [Algoriphagus sp.]|uniref:glycerate kinase n=1 Tax=Algoriphagus sp. TaxID=1872435 RepID=UPI003919CC55
MKFLIAPNAFKGTMSAEEAALIIAEKIGQQSDSQYIIQPVADGGDGTCGLLIDSLGLEKIQVLTLNAIGQPIMAYFGWDAGNKKAFLDVSTASGLGVLESCQKDPNSASTFGTGLLIKKAIELGANEIIIGLGGSATVDMGTGILSALGILFLDENGREIPVFSPKFLQKIQHIQKSPEIPQAHFTCLCDVRNPFLGEIGAVNVFGPQKGLPSNQVDIFENDCERVLKLLIKKSKKEWKDLPGYGAAGGIAMGLQFFFPSEIKFGADYFLDLVGIKEKIKTVDWIVTGEGQYDAQSDQGKASFALLQLAKSMGKKIALITSGSGGRNAGFDAVLELPKLDFSRNDFKEKARQNLDRLLQDAFSERNFS